MDNEKTENMLTLISQDLIKKVISLSTQKPLSELKD